MKLKFALGTVMVGATSLVGMSSALAGYGMAGCGLGSMVFVQDGIVQIFAATTNGTFGNQTFGITTGTSNCTRAGVVMADKEQEAFFEANYTALQGDMARGGGEHLAALTGLMGCDDQLVPNVSQFAQAEYESVFPNSQTTPVQALYTFKVKMSQDQRFSSACKKL